MDDNDVKIFVAKSKKENDDSIALIEEMNTQRSNGNRQRAKDLGKYLAERFLNTEQLCKELETKVGLLDYPEEIIFQVEILVFFTAEYCINRLLPNTLVKSTAINTIYDEIHKKNDAFYKTFSDSIEYSFYYLALKKEDVITALGKAFAMICRKEKDESFIELGKNVFIAVTKEVESIIAGYEFVA